jgi:hypothetical protein
MGLIDPCRQRLAIPEIDPHPRVTRFGPQHPIDFFHLFFVQSAGASGSLSLGQTGQPLPIKAMNPVLYRTRRVAQQTSHLRASHALRYQ